MINLNEEKNSERVATAALQLFFSISKKWNLSVEQEMTLLGSPIKNEFMIWRSSKSSIGLEDETLMRISHLVNIYKNLNTLLSSKKSANEWLMQPNMANLFNGDSALKYMLDGQLSSIKQVHDYLDDEILGIHHQVNV